jgi:GMP synthase-like glutamine amidotransferase
VEEGVYPSDSDVDKVDGFIITGSKSSAYEDKEWIRNLERLVQELHAKRKKMVGICFGHQVIARALGGTVAKSDKGWGVGVNVYSISELPVQVDDEVRAGGSSFLKLVASHQDQVTVLPPGARNVVSNDHCENAGFVMGDHVLTLQGHPEFSAEYSEAIMAFRHDMIGAERVAQGRASLVTHQHEGPRVARWMVDFLSA